MFVHSRSPSYIIPFNHTNTHLHTNKCINLYTMYDACSMWCAYVICFITIMGEQCRYWCGTCLWFCQCMNAMRYKNRQSAFFPRINNAYLWCFVLIFISISATTLQAQNEYMRKKIVYHFFCWLTHVVQCSIQSKHTSHAIIIIYSSGM